MRTKRRGKFGLHIHSVALLIEALGTALVYFDSVRMDAQLTAAGYVSYAGKAPPGYEGWIYHSAFAGFVLLLVGILLAGFLLWLEHRNRVD
jgi:hypothetical protein